MEIKPGDRVESRCTRCKDLMGHVIVSMIGAEILKVECCACKSIHKYYPPAQKKEKKKESTLRVRAGETRSSAVKEKSARTKAVEEKSTQTKPKMSKSLVEIQENWQKAINSNTSAPIPYSMNVEVGLETVVDHSVFGLGIVVEIFPPDKANFLFSEGIKSLRCKV